MVLREKYIYSVPINDQANKIFSDCFREKKRKETGKTQVIHNYYPKRLQSLEEK